MCILTYRSNSWRYVTLRILSTLTLGCFWTISTWLCGEYCILVFIFIIQIDVINLPLKETLHVSTHGTGIYFQAYPGTLESVRAKVQVPRV